jgi:hypothetical protein
VIDIFKLRGTAQQLRRGASVARSFGVTPKAIRDIWNLKTWADITSKIDTTASSTSTEGTVPAKRLKRSKEVFLPISTEQSTTPMPGTVPARPTDQSKAIRAVKMQIPMACALPVRFDAIAHRQIDRIVAKRKTSCTAAPLYPSPAKSNDGGGAPPPPPPSLAHLDPATALSATVATGRASMCAVHRVGWLRDYDGGPTDFPPASVPGCRAGLPLASPACFLPMARPSGPQRSLRTGSTGGYGRMPPAPAPPAQSSPPGSLSESPAFGEVWLKLEAVECWRDAVAAGNWQPPLIAAATAAAAPQRPAAAAGLEPPDYLYAGGGWDAAAAAAAAADLMAWADGGDSDGEAGLLDSTGRAPAPAVAQHRTAGWLAEAGLFQTAPWAPAAPGSAAAGWGWGMGRCA